MPSSREYLDFTLARLSDLPEISYKAMMGEYLLYYRGKLVGGVYDDRFLITPVKSALALIPDAAFESPYPGAKPMLAVDADKSADFLAALFDAMFDDLPTPKKKRRSNG
ncbi:MAG: hypothetical protein IJ991_16465 [Thermoguttaceae bacterium]|nr:hypothetical protein [Thermoguttaceae bacterium]